VTLGTLLSPGATLRYEYDFGTTTELTIKVAAVRRGPADAEFIRLLARNDPPEVPCESCGRPAARICSQCIFEGGGWLCRACARKHKCGEEMLLPVVNSPRVGMCGYTG
jgi:hypothetical protein